MTFNIPLTLYLGYYLHYQMHQSRRTTGYSLCHRLCHIYLPFLALFIFQSSLTLTEFPATYGLRAVFLGPVRTGSLILGVYLYNAVSRINPNTLVTEHNQQ